VLLPALALAIALVQPAPGPGPGAGGTSPADAVAKAPPDWKALWADAARWAEAARTTPESCVFSFRFDPRTRRIASGYALTCDEPFRSPFYPWPEPSRAGARWSVDEIERYHADHARANPARIGRPVGAPLAGPLEACGLVVGFTADGQGAAAIECYWPDGNVLGQRANTEVVVKTADGRQTSSRLYERMSHMPSPPPRSPVAGAPAPAAPERTPDVRLQIDGAVLDRHAHDVEIRGRALPVPGGPAAGPGVLTSEAAIVVEYPSDDALRPGYYYGGEHCFKGTRERAGSRGGRETVWVYGPCPLGPDEYWAFEQHPPGERTISHGPYREYGECDRDRRTLMRTRAGVGGQCAKKPKVAFRMTRDGTLQVPPGAPSVE